MLMEHGAWRCRQFIVVRVRYHDGAALLKQFTVEEHVIVGNACVQGLFGFRTQSCPDGRAAGSKECPGGDAKCIYQTYTRTQ